MAPKHDEKPAASGDAAAFRQQMRLALVRMNGRTRVVRRPAASVDLTPDQVREEMARRCRRMRRDRARQCMRAFYREVVDTARRIRKASYSLKGPPPTTMMDRVPSSTEDGLAAMMEQLATTTTSAAGGDRATVDVPSPAADHHQSGHGEMMFFEKTAAVASNSATE